MSRVLVTGAAGFIGSHVAAKLLDDGDEVIGVDNLNPYYDPSLKEARLARLTGRKGFRFEQTSVEDRDAVARLFRTHQPDLVVHLAAQAGVRYSLTNPETYIDANLVGFGTILEGCRHHGVRHLVYASSSSVYGANTAIPFSEHHIADHPVSLYAATKRANELMAHTYSHLFGLPTTGLRFFTVYGPWGRPDMAAFIFTRAIIAGEPIDVFNEGRMKRDFTFISDIAEGVVRSVRTVPTGDPSWSGDLPDPATSKAPYRLFNIGNDNPVELLRFIRILEERIGKDAVLNLLPMQPGDVPATWANVDDLANITGFRPKTSIEDGLAAFVDWYRDYYHV